MADEPLFDFRFYLGILILLDFNLVAAIKFIFKNSSISQGCNIWPIVELIAHVM